MSDQHIGTVRKVNDDGTVSVELNNHGIEAILKEHPNLFSGKVLQADE